MRNILYSLIFTPALLTAADKTQTFTGVITDTMCGADHAMMNVKPDSKCVRDCVKMDPAKWKYALLAGKDVHALSDQKTAEKFAGQKVRVTGALDAKSGTLKVDRMEAVR